MLKKTSVFTENNWLFSGIANIPDYTICKNTTSHLRSIPETGMLVEKVFALAARFNNAL